MDKFVVSARKYRPVTFNEVVGQNAITNTLKNAIKYNHIAQAFLFTGPRGVGKTTCARIFAKTINCESLTEDMEPCNNCESCKSFDSSSSFNVHELDAASNNSVDDIRRLVEQVRIPPQVGKYKVYIIDEVHMLSQAAFNAFLKTLEEPPDYAKFILATTEKYKIIPTILSRCQIYDFNRITVSDIANHLRYVAETEGIVAEEEALHIIAKKADGALRDALSIFDQIVSFTGKNITYESTILNLNVLDIENYFKLTSILLDKDITQSFLLYDDILAKGFDGNHFIGGLAEHFRNLLVVKDKATVKLMEVPDAVKKHYIEQTQFCNLKFLISALEICSNVDLNYKAAVDKRLFVELNLLKLCQLNGEIQDAEIVKKPLQNSAQAAIKSETAKIVEQSQKPIDIEKPEPTVLKAPPDMTETDMKKPISEINFFKKEIAAEKDITLNDIASASASGDAENVEKTPTQGLNKFANFGFSIKDDIKDQGAVINKEKKVNGELEKVNENVIKIIPSKDLKEAVNQYATIIKLEEIAFSKALNPDKISIEENNTVKIILTNKGMDDRDKKNNLLKFLREKFDNSQILLQVEVIEDEVLLRDDPMENYIKIKEINPVVEKIRSQLDLDF